MATRDPVFEVHLAKRTQFQ